MVRKNKKESAADIPAEDQAEHVQPDSSFEEKRPLPETEEKPVFSTEKKPAVSKKVKPMETEMESVTAEEAKSEVATAVEPEAENGIKSAPSKRKRARTAAKAAKPEEPKTAKPQELKTEELAYDEAGTEDPDKELKGNGFDTIKEMVNNITHGDKKYDKTTLLKMRADELSQDLENEESDADYIHIIEFILMQDKYGIEADYVKEVYPLKNLKKIPCTPPHIVGVVNFHGQILPVVDLKVVMELPPSELDRRSTVIILSSELMEFGILADALIGNNHVPTSSLQTSLSNMSDIQEEYFKAITTEKTLILNGAKILNDTKLIVKDN
jgi:purine-binding chemotaxis protein CheW